MPLHPQAKGFLDQLAALGGPAIDELAPPQARELYRALAAMTPSEEVSRVEDRLARTPAGPVPLRVYWPASDPGPAPALVWYHGGGWVIGDLETADATARCLANRSGAVVVSVDYRLAPEHRFPAAVGDALAALRWVSEHSEDLGVDPGRLAVGGDSAGGNLAAVAALSSRAGHAPELRHQLLVYPVTDLSRRRRSYHDNAEGYFLTQRAMDWFIDHYTDPADRADPRCSPLLASDLSGLAPAMVVTAEFDPLRDEGDAYAEAMAAAGVPVQHVQVAGQFHGFFALHGILDDALHAIDQAGAALRRALGGAP